MSAGNELREGWRTVATVECCCGGRADVQVREKCLWQISCESCVRSVVGWSHEEARAGFASVVIHARDPEVA